MAKSVSLSRPTRPILDFPHTSLEVACNFLGGSGILILFFLVANAWPNLPDLVPLHFDFRGEPDTWGSKWIILVLPLIGALVYVGLTILRRYPHHFNYPWPISEHNAPKQYLLSHVLLGILKVEIVGLFIFIEWKTIQTAMGSAEGLGVAFGPLAIVIVLSTVGIHFVQAYRLR